MKLPSGTESIVRTIVDVSSLHGSLPYAIIDNGTKPNSPGPLK